MRKLLLLCFLCFTWIARGQDEYRWHYWFDANHDAVVSGTTQSRYFTIDADASDLDFGAHTFNFQVEGKDGKSSSPISKYFYYSNSKLDKLTYWFDNDTQSMKEESGKDGHFILDVSSIEPGIHFINLMLRDASGRISEIKQECFYRVINKTATKLTYWFDDDESTKETIAFHDGTSMFDVTKLQEGFHPISIVTHDYTSSAIATRMFIKVPQTQGGDFDMVCLCSVDGKLVAQDRLPSTGGILNFNLDVNNIDPGLHKALFQTITPTGAASNIVERYFIRTTTNNEIGTMKCLYSIDDAKTYTQAGNFANGLFHFDLDVASLADGLHRLAYMLIADNGVSTPMQSAFFWKTPVGGNAITQYDYWLNDNEADAKKVTLAERNNPFSLITLLPIESCPIRSSCFQFEVKDGKPMMYARNDIHFRFFDVAARLAEATKQFVDYSISQEVSDIAELQSTQTFARPAENAVKWFKVDVEEGDTVAFKSSQATSIQVFSPSGEEIYSASGDKSVKYGGAHTWEDGTYYVAVHDVTGSKPSVTLDYMHMDKYDVVNQDVRVVGNGGCSSITYQGNGFRDLYAVDLYTVNGDTIHSVDVNFISDATTMVTFDFSDTEIGKYHALFHFTGEDKKFLNNITVEMARDIELATKVTYPSTFLRGTSTTYTIEITNKGNMTAYNLPVYAYIASPDAHSISYIKLHGAELEDIFDDIKSNELLAAYLDDFESISNKLGDDPYFLKVKGVSENLNDSVLIRTNYLHFNIPPKKTITLSLQLISKDNVDVWFTIPEEWISISDEDTSKSIKVKKYSQRSGASSWFCCYVESVNCALDVFKVACDISSIVAGMLTISCPELAPETISIAITNSIMGCVSSSASEGLRQFTYSVCESDGKSGKAKMKDGLRNATKSIFTPKRVIGCLTETLLNFGDLIPIEVIKNCVSSAALALGGNSIYNDAKMLSSDNFSCKSMMRRKPGCPPTPPKGGTSTPINSCEPNDIRGYTSESGSTFMRNDVEEVSYIIDSENDPVFADAPAHTVIITDTINGDYYDLESLSTRNITIGDVSMELDGTEKNFIKTMDLRPRINVIAQVEQKYDTKTGIAKWIWTSLDPMTMEPTDDVMQGVLPVNDETHLGEGHVTFKLKQKMGLPNGTDVTNQADIVFDSNEPVFTPVWTNTIDAIAPISAVASVDIKNDSTATVKVQATDNLSGVWKYDVYVRYGSEGSSWYKAVEGATTEDIDVKYYKDVIHAFCVVATDSAGNMEQKELVAEFELSNGVLGDANLDGFVNVNDITTIAKFILEGKVSPWSKVNADVNEDGTINVNDITKTAEIILLRAKAEMEAKAAMEAAFKAADSED